MRDNLLIVTTYYPHNKNNLSGLFVKRQVDELKKYFNRIYVFAVNPWIPPPISKLNKVPKATADIFFAKNYSYDNVDVFFLKALPIQYYKNYGIRLARKSIALIKRKNLNFRYIHAHFSYPSGYVARCIKRIFNIPMILTVHENSDWFLDEVNSKKPLLVETWKNADKIIRVNKRDLLHFKQFKINDSNLINIPNGYPAELFKSLDIKDTRNKLNIPLDKKIILNIANLEIYKGHKYLINAVDLLAKRNYDFILYIVGIGSLKQKLKNQVDNLNLGSKVIFAGGNKSSEEISLWYNSCDLFVISSLSEGNPTVMFETLGCGKPLVATDVGGISEIITNEKLGIVVEPKNPKQLCDAMIMALDTEWDYNYIKEYSKNFTWEKIAESIVELYKSI